MFSTQNCPVSLEWREHRLFQELFLLLVLFLVLVVSFVVQWSCGTSSHLLNRLVQIPRLQVSLTTLTQDRALLLLMPAVLFWT